MLCSAFVALALQFGGQPPPKPPVPRLDADGLPLPAEAVRRFGSARFCTDHPKVVAYSPDGTVAYLARADNLVPWPDDPPAVSAWEVASGRMLWRFLDRELNGLVLAVEPDGKTIWLAGVTGRIDDAKPGKASAVRVKLSAASGRQLDRATLGLVGSAALDVRADGVVAWYRYDPKKEEVTFPLTAADGKEVSVFDPTDQSILRVKFSPDGKVLFAGGWENAGFAHKLAAVEVATGKAKWSADTGVQDTLAVSPDGKLVAVAVAGVAPKRPFDQRHDSKGTLVVGRRADTGEEVGSLAVGQVDFSTYQTNTPRLGRPMAFTPDGKTLLVMDDKRQTLAVDAGTWKAADDPRTDWSAYGWFAPDGKTYLTYPHGGRHLTRHDAKTREPIDPPPALMRWESAFYQNERGELAFSADGRRLLHRYYGYVWVEWDAATGKEVARAEAGKQRDEPREGVMGINSDPRSTLRSPDGKLLLRRFSSRLKGKEGLAEVVDAASGDQVAILAVHGFSPFAFTPDSKRIVGVNSRDGAVRVWDTAGGEPATADGTPSERGPDGTDFLRLHPSGGWAAVAVTLRDRSDRYDDTLWRLSLYALDPLAKKKSWDGRGRIERFDLTPGGRIVGWASPYGSDKQPHHTLVVCDPDADEPRIVPLAGRPTAFAVSPDGRTAAFGVGSGDIELYETATGKKRHTFTGLKRLVNSLAFSPDGKTLASESPDGPVLLWDVRGDLLAKLAPDAVGWDALFQQLADDAEPAFAAVRAFAVHPDGPAELEKRLAKIERAGPVVAERAVEAVRLADSPAATKVLAGWAKGDAKNPLTAAARR